MSEKGPAVPVGGGVPVDPETGRRYGYLPRKSAQRKLVIRAELGRHWILGSLAAGLVILALGVAYLVLRSDAPGPPYVDQGPLSRYAQGEVTPLLDGSGWLDRRAGLRAVAGRAAGGQVAFCPADGGWVDETGRRYAPPGAAEPGSSGLTIRPVRVSAGRVYVDPTSGEPPAPAVVDLGPCPAPRRLADPAPPDGL